MVCYGAGTLSIILPGRCDCVVLISLLLCLFSLQLLCIIKIGLFVWEQFSWLSMPSLATTGDLSSMASFEVSPVLTVATANLPFCLPEGRTSKTYSSGINGIC